MAALQDEAPARRIGRGASTSDDRSLGTSANELKTLVVTYARQETLDPLKKLGRYLLWGVVGSFLLAVGSVLLTIGVVRAIQAETGTHLTGHLSWIPYLGGLAFAAIVLAVAATRITKSPR